MARWNVPGMVIGLLHKGSTHAWGFGVANVETGVPVTPDTLFRICSITKPFTATLVMQLVEKGLLDLDTPVVRYLPSLQLADAAATRAVTLRHLLSHTAGFSTEKWEDYGPGDDALPRAIAEYGSLRQITAPGELWTYGNTNYNLAGAVVQVARGVRFEAAMRERLFKPLGLGRTFFFAHQAITYRVAAGHNAAGQPPAVWRPFQIPWWQHAAGGILSTAADLLRFADLHMRDSSVVPVISDTSVRTMQTPQVDAVWTRHWGLGWGLDEIDGVRVVSHSGATAGFEARLTLVPERATAIVILTNSTTGHGAIRPIERWLLARHAGVEMRDPVTVSLSADVLGLLVGRYDGHFYAISVTAAGDGIDVHWRGKPALGDHGSPDAQVHAVPVGGLRFRVATVGEFEGALLDFVTGPGGMPRFIRLGTELAEYKRATPAANGDRSSRG